MLSSKRFYSELGNLFYSLVPYGYIQPDTGYYTAVKEIILLQWTDTNSVSKTIDTSNASAIIYQLNIQFHSLPEPHRAAASFEKFFSEYNEGIGSAMRNQIFNTSKQIIGLFPDVYDDDSNCLLPLKSLLEL